MSLSGSARYCLAGRGVHGFHSLQPRFASPNRLRFPEILSVAARVPRREHVDQRIPANEPGTFARCLAGLRLQRQDRRRRLQRWRVDDRIGWFDSSRPDRRKQRQRRRGRRDREADDVHARPGGPHLPQDQGPAGRDALLGCGRQHRRDDGPGGPAAADHHLDDRPDLPAAVPGEDDPVLPQPVPADRVHADRGLQAAAARERRVRLRAARDGRRRRRRLLQAGAEPPGQLRADRLADGQGRDRAVLGRAHARRSS